MPEFLYTNCCKWTTGLRMIHEDHHIQKCIHGLFQTCWLKCKPPPHFCYTLYFLASPPPSLKQYNHILCCASMTKPKAYEKAKLKLMHHFLKTFNISQALQHKHALPVLHSILSLPKLIWQRLLWNRCQSYVVTSCTLEDSNLGCDAALLGEYCLLLHGQPSCPFLQQFILHVPLDSCIYRQNEPLQSKELLTQWHSITPQAICIFSNTAVRTSNLSSKFRFKAWHSFKK